MSVVKRVLWILDNLATRDYSFGQLSAKWDYATANENRETLSSRVFRNDIATIEELFGVRIICDHYGEYRYHIENVGPLLESLRGLLSCIDERKCTQEIQRRKEAC